MRILRHQIDHQSIGQCISHRIRRNLINLSIRTNDDYLHSFCRDIHFALVETNLLLSKESTLCWERQRFEQNWPLPRWYWTKGSLEQNGICNVEPTEVMRAVVYVCAIAPMICLSMTDVNLISARQYQISVKYLAFCFPLRSFRCQGTNTCRTTQYKPLNCFCYVSV